MSSLLRNSAAALGVAALSSLAFGGQAAQARQTVEKTKASTRADAPAPASGLLAFTDYSRSLNGSMSPAWGHEQVPSTPAGGAQPSRIQVVPAPGAAADQYKPADPVMRVELRPYDDPTHPGGADGDVTNTGGYLANRAEVYDRIATRTTAPTAWPDPIGSTRWYGFSLFVPSDFQMQSKKWFDFTQWKGLDGGSPPEALEINGANFELGGTGPRASLGPIVPGRWTRFVVGIKFSDDAQQGWVTVIRDGQVKVSALPSATMDDLMRFNGRATVDPTYLKQGIYRSTAWNVTSVLYFGPTKIGTTAGDVM